MKKRKCRVCDTVFDKPAKETWSYYSQRRFCSYECYWHSKVGSKPWNRGIKRWSLGTRAGFQKGNQLWKLRESTRRLSYVHKGYKYLYSPEHPFHNKQGYVKEHRLVMEKKLGRYLTRKEVVHHINHDKEDNDVLNLQLFPDNKTHLNVAHSRAA